MFSWVKSVANIFSKRSTTEIVVIVITVTVCFSVVATGTSLALIGILHPGTDISKATQLLTGLLNTLIGLLAGFLAGRTNKELNEPPKQDDE
jgi:Na+/H+-dicarboxylate symporter